MNSFALKFLSSLAVVWSFVYLAMFVVQVRFWKKQQSVLIFFTALGAGITSLLVALVFFDGISFFDGAKLSSAFGLFTIGALLGLVIHSLFGLERSQIRRISFRFPILGFLTGWLLDPKWMVLVLVGLVIIIARAVFSRRGDFQLVWRKIIKFSLVVMLAVGISYMPGQWWALALPFGFYYLQGILSNFSAMSFFDEVNS